MKKLLLLATLAIGLNTLGQVPSYVPSNGLVGWWPFNGNANDESGNGIDGSVNSATLTSDRFGNPNSAYYFDGTDDFINIGNLTEINGVSQMTWSAWVHPTTIGMEHAVIAKRTIDTQDEYMALYLTNFSCNVNSTRISIASSGDHNGASVDNSLADNTLYHLSIVYNGLGSTDAQKLKVYINGIIQTSDYRNNTSCVNNAVPSLTPVNNMDVYFGAAPPGSFPGLGTSWFLGDIDDIGIWNRALTECEVQNLFNSQSIISATQNGSLLTADTVGASYQWLDCDNNYMIINGETNQSYTPAITGNYAVEVTLNGCVDTSACFLVDYTGIEELLQNEKKLVKIVDFMGRETELKPNTPLIFIYSDGTRERIIKLEE